MIIYLNIYPVKYIIETVSWGETVSKVLTYFRLSFLTNTHRTERLIHSVCKIIVKSEVTCNYSTVCTLAFQQLSKVYQNILQYFCIHHY